MTTKLLMCVKDGKSSIKLSVTYKYIPRDLKRKTLKIGKKKKAEEERTRETHFMTPVGTRSTVWKKCYSRQVLFHISRVNGSSTEIVNS